MKPPPRPINEAARLEALRRYAVLDTLPEQSLDDLTRLASVLCDTPVSQVSLIDEERQFIKSSVGLPISDTPREFSFCAHAILEPGLLIVEDTTMDEQFADNPLVTGAPRIRFYAGAPLVTPEGESLGALCVIDQVPRTLTASQQEGLQILSGQVMAQLELRRRTDELRLSHERFQIVSRATNDVVWDWDLVTNALWWNEGYQLQFGYPPEETDPTIASWTSQLHPDDADRIGQGVHAAIDRGDQSWSDEYRFRRKNGSYATIFDRGFILRDDTGKAVRMIGAMEDLTERREVEAARRSSDTRYRTLFDYAPDGILIADAGSVYLDANPSICRMLGRSREELVGLRAADIVDPAEVPNIAPALRAIVSSTGYHHEWNFLRKDGSTFPADVIATAMPDGKLLAMVRDISERKQLEQQFLRTQRLESIGTLAGGIAHDLNNVLAPILLSLEMLHDHVTSVDGVELLATLQGSAQHGADLVKQVLAFARGVEGQRAPLNPHQLIRDLMTVIRDTFPKSIGLQFTQPESLWTVLGDRTQLHQVFLNLCVNARDAMPDGGTLTISMETVTLDETYAAMHLDARPGDYVIVSVADTGGGIPPEFRDRILEPFFTTKELGKGTGLGLSTALAIIKSHGGFIHINSEAGRGARFKVYLPADATSPIAGSLPPTVARLPAGTGELILVVDDEEAIRKVAKRTLERFGYRVELASNGAEAVAIYARLGDGVAAVLTDMSMPIMDGAALIVALKAMNPEVRVIGSSGQASGAALARSLGTEPSHFVPKPYTAQALLQAVQEALNASP